MTGERDIMALKVNCDNLDNGCQWVGELRSLEEHVQNCDYTLLPCTNECKIHNVTVTVLRKDLDNHLTNGCPKRQYQCVHCMEMGEYEERTMEHLKTCRRITIHCPNDQCGTTFSRIMLPFHRLSCRYEKQPCKYAELGCMDKPFRKDLKEHEEDYQLHLQITTKSVLEQKQQLQQLKQENNNLKEVLETKSKKQLTFKLSSFTEKKSNNEHFYSSPFYTSQNGYRICICVDANGEGDGEGTHVSVFVHLMKGDNDESLTWPFTGNVIIELLNQLEDKYHHRTSIPFTAHRGLGKRVTKGKRGEGLGRQNFIVHSDLQDNYLVDDALFFRVSVDVPNYKPWLECTSTD